MPNQGLVSFRVEDHTVSGHLHALGFSPLTWARSSMAPESLLLQCVVLMSILTWGRCCAGFLPCLTLQVRASNHWEEPGLLSLCFSFASAVNLHELCAHRVLEILRNKVHRTEEVKDVEFYAFSYYYDLAANVGLIGKDGADVWIPWAEAPRQRVIISSVTLTARNRQEGKCLVIHIGSSKPPFQGGLST